LHERELKVAEEKERLKDAERRAVIDVTGDHKLYKICAEGGNLTQDEIQKCVLDLKQEGVMNNDMVWIIQGVFVPWLNIEVHQEVRMQGLSRSLLDGKILYMNERTLMSTKKTYHNYSCLVF
jgi:hypothetical protein